MAEVVSKVVTRYACSACGRSWASKSRAAQHAVSCPKDPANRGCPTCRFDSGRAYYEDGPACALGISRGGRACITDCDRWEPKAHLVSHIIDIKVTAPPGGPGA